MIVNFRTTKQDRKEKTQQCNDTNAHLPAEAMHNRYWQQALLYTLTTVFVTFKLRHYAYYIQQH